MKNLHLFALALVLLGGIASATPANAASIVDIATSDSNFSSLVNALSSQKLVTTLQGDGPFTVFAPTNKAFEKIPSYVTDVIAENPEYLTDILLYHVVAGENFAKDVVAKKKIKTVQGESVRVSTSGSNVFINQAKVTTANVDANNGVVHVIDKVLIPNVVYKAVLEDIRKDLAHLIKLNKEVRMDQLNNFRGAHNK